MVSLFPRKSKESAKMPIPQAPQAPPKPPSLPPDENVREDALEKKIEETTEEAKKLFGPQSQEPKSAEEQSMEAQREHTVQVEGDSKTPPVFIKIDRYGEVVKNIQRLKTFALGLRDALDPKMKR